MRKQVKIHDNKERRFEVVIVNDDDSETSFVFFFVDFYLLVQHYKGMLYFVVQIWIPICI